MAVIPNYGSTNPPVDILPTPEPLALKPVPNPPPPNPRKLYRPPRCSPLARVSRPAPLRSTRRMFGYCDLGRREYEQRSFINVTGATPAVTNQVTSGGNLATGVAVDDQLTLLTPPQSNLAAVVNYASKSLSLLSVPAGTPIATVDLSCVIPQSDSLCKASPETVSILRGHRSVCASSCCGICFHKRRSGHQFG